MPRRASWRMAGESILSGSIAPPETRREYVKRRRASRRIDGAGRRPGPAPGDPPEGLPTPRPGAVLADRPLAIVAAGGLEPAPDADRPHPRRERGLVEMDAAEQHPRRDLVARRPRHVDPQEEQDDEDREPDFEASAAEGVHGENLNHTDEHGRSRTDTDYHGQR